jgi:hypothetical protein
MSVLLERVAGTDWWFDGVVYDLPPLSTVTATSPVKDISGCTLYLTVKPVPIVEGEGIIDVSMIAPSDANSAAGLFRFEVGNGPTDIDPGRYEMQILLREADGSDVVPIFTGRLQVTPRLKTTLP